MVTMSPVTARDRNRARPLLRLGMQAHSDSDLVDPFQGASGNFLDEILAVLTVAVRRRDFD